MFSTERKKRRRARMGRAAKIRIWLATLRIPKHGLKESIDTTTATGKFTFYIMAVLAAFECDLISERTQAGLEAAWTRGRKGGRPAATQKMRAADLERARELYARQTMSVAEIMRRTDF